MVPSRALLSVAALVSALAARSAFARTIRTTECVVDVTIGNLCIIDSIGATLGIGLGVALGLTAVGIGVALALKLIIGLLQHIAKSLKGQSPT